MMRDLLRVVVGTLSVALLAACATAPSSKDYTTFRAEDPHSILIVPALNDSVQVDAADYFMATVSKPFAERGYYVFPAHMVKRLLEEDGLSDAGLVHSADPRKLGQLFGCNSVLFVTIDKWQSQYVVITTQTTVQFEYLLKSCKTGAVLWQNTETMTYSPQPASSANPLAALIADAIVAALEKANPQYIPLTQQANLQAAATAGTGLPAGPYSADYGKDLSAFPAGAAGH